MGLFNYSSKLSDEQLRRISLSAQYQGQQGGDHFTLSSKIGSRAKSTPRTRLGYHKSTRIMRYDRGITRTLPLTLILLL